MNLLTISGRLIIHGRPRVLKNSKQICFNKRTGARFIKSNPRVEAYQHSAIQQIMAQWKNKEPITCPLRMKALFFGAWKDGQRNTPDLSNLYELPQDLLEICGVISNDSQIQSHDGSRLVAMCDGPCPMKDVYKAGPRKGERKDTCTCKRSGCPFERVEITLSPLEHSVMGPSQVYPTPAECRG